MRLIKASTLAGLERRVRPYMARLPPDIAVSVYSRGRSYFLEKLKDEIPPETYNPPADLSRELWDIRFRTPIMNAAGMFKNGECYDMVARQGAGAYLGGTGTWNARTGNRKCGISLPFVPYPNSHASSNCLGLPNDGDVVNSQRAARLERSKSCPVCWSVMGSPDFREDEGLEHLVRGMRLYEGAGIDLLELNESCPNTAHGQSQDVGLAKRLGYVNEHFLKKRQRRLPVVVKFSNGTKTSQLPHLLDLLFELGYDGVNLGNTSTAYDDVRGSIDPSDAKLFDFFAQTFGGGVSGRPLRESSLELASRASKYTRAGPPPQEFHVIRTGGIETWDDIKASERERIYLNQWFTGYFDGFAVHGHDVYRRMLGD